LLQFPTVDQQVDFILFSFRFSLLPAQQLVVFQFQLFDLLVGRDV
jgi:hypothetical protein